jgi:Tfp pilus assembly protein PilV
MTAISNKRPKTAGFSLLEVLIALGLLATALLGIFHLQGQNLELQHEGQFMTLATQLVRQRMAQIQSRATLDEGTDEGDFGEDFPGFSYREEIETVPEMANLLRVRVSVILDGENDQKDLQVETYIYRQKL